MDKKEEEDEAIPFYAKDSEVRSVLYSDMKINDTEYSVADICFVCDTTGSMNQYIKTVRETLMDFLKFVSKQLNEDLFIAKPRIAFVMFKDKGDKNQIEIKGFETDYEKVLNFIETVKCVGGGDTCEDLVTPLMKVLDLEWSSDLNLVYLILDAPPHGKSYHTDKYSDDYPEDDKDKYLEKLASHYRRNNINLAVLKCNDSVNEMIDVLRRYYDSLANKIKVIDINKSDLLQEDYRKFFLRSLMDTFRDSYSSTRHRNFRRIREKDPEPEEVKGQYELEFGTSFTGKVHTGSIKGLNFSKKKFSYLPDLTSSAEVKCEISGSKIGIGTFADCYPLHAGEDKNYVAKIPKMEVKEAKELFPDIEGTLVTRLFAERFNIALKEAEKKQKGTQKNYQYIRVLPLNIIENLIPEQSKRAKFFLGQKCLAGEFIKFNNNYGWRNDKDGRTNLIAQAFSHFTYEYSTGAMMVTDVQGIVDGESGEIVLTDPAVHSFIYKQRFGKTNCGKLGMIRFFMTHKCNDYCKKLHLIHPKDIDKTIVQKIKEERKGERTLKHLYEEFKPNIKKWREKIQTFDPNLEPELDPIEEEEEEEEGDSTVTRTTAKHKPKQK